MVSAKYKSRWFQVSMPPRNIRKQAETVRTNFHQSSRAQRFRATKQMFNKEKGNSQKLLAYAYMFYNKSVITLNIKGLNIPIKRQRLSN